MDNFLNFIKLYAPNKPQPWDNTGLLINCDSPLNKILLTIDVTDAVILEAKKLGISLILSYHPVIFTGLKHIDNKYISLIKAGISVYSIHTSLDSKMCLNISALLKIQVILTSDTFVVAENKNQILKEEFLRICNSKFCNSKGLRYVDYPGLTPNKIVIGVGAAQNEFKSIDGVDLIITGEMSHHDLLYYKSKGCCVILLEHCNSERYYLEKWKEDMIEAGFKVLISKADETPIKNFY